MRIVPICALLFGFCTVLSAEDKELRDLAASLSAQVKAKGKGPVAVTSFSNPRYGALFSAYLVDRLDVLLVKGNSDFDVVTRDRVEEAFKEINLALGQNYDSSTFAKIGKHLGARALIRGSYSVESAGVKVSVVAQIIDVETGRIIGGEMAEIPYTDDVRAMMTMPEIASGPRLEPGALKDGTPPPTQVVGIIFRAAECRHLGADVACELLMENTLPYPLSIYMYISNLSRAIDSSGTEYRNMIGGTTKGNFNYSQFPVELASGVPLRLHVSIPGVAEKLSMFRLLQIHFDIRKGGSGEHDVLIKSLPIE